MKMLVIKRVLPVLGRVRISVEKLQAILTLNERYFHCVRDPFQQQKEAMRCVLFLHFLLYYRDTMKTTSSLATPVLRPSSCNLPDLISWGKEKCEEKRDEKSNILHMLQFALYATNPCFRHCYIRRATI